MGPQNHPLKAIPAGNSEMALIDGHTHPEAVPLDPSNRLSGRYLSPPWSNGLLCGGGVADGATKEDAVS